MFKPKVSVITVNYNQTQVTLECLRSLNQQDYKELEIIVVDNASKEDPAQQILAEFPTVRYIPSDRNLGFAGGNNLGVAVAQGEYLFFINNDTELTNTCIDRLSNFLDEHPGCGAVSPLICYFKEGAAGEDIIQYAGMTPVSKTTARNTTLGSGSLDKGQYSVPTETAYVHGAAMMVPKHVVEEVGTMAEHFFLYYEELDWCERIKRAGYGVWIDPRAKIYHKESASVGQSSPLKTYFLNRNRILFVARNYPASKVLFGGYMWFVVAPKMTLNYVFNLDWANLKAFWLAMSWYYLGRRNRFER
jgi:GT2 family glycosyltransferase